MTNALTTQPGRGELAHTAALRQAGQAANEAGARHTFADHTDRKADNTVRRKRADIALFESFLNECQIPARDLFDNPAAWHGVTWGIVKAFGEWQLKRGYAIGSINGRLSTVRTYASLAAQAGAISPDELRLIQTVKGYSSKEAKHIDDRRRADGVGVRIGAKKAEAVSIPDDIAEKLKAQPETPQGARDRLMMCLLLEHGLRVEEVAILTRKAFDLKANHGNGTLTFYRPKVDKTQTHKLTPATREAARAYLKYAPEVGTIWRKSSKGTGKLGGQIGEKNATRILCYRVELLGRHAGIEGLSPHDCRHYWVTWELAQGTREGDLMDAGGWKSTAMVYRYREAAHIANEGTARVKPA